MLPLRAAAISLLSLTLLGAPSDAEVHVSVDANGRTTITNDPTRVAPDAETRATLNGLWEGELTGPPVSARDSASSRPESRSARILEAAVDDLRRGETERATAALQEVLRQDPGRPEAHFHLAMIAWRRGKFDEAEAHLEAFLAAAGDGLSGWRESAERRLAQLADERVLHQGESGPLELVSVAHPEFDVQADAALLRAGSNAFQEAVGRYLNDARTLVSTGLGIVPEEPTGVVLYGKAAYTRAHAARFSFQTVGFFDGRIHAVSNAHPKGELRTLLIHEYTHALFREKSGGDQPFWWNEGLAELFERESLARPPLSRAERSRLRAAIRDGQWIPLRRLGPSFAGLNDREARLAYTQSAAAADWIDRHSTPDERRQILEKIGEGHATDVAFLRVLGIDTHTIDVRVRAELTASGQGQAAQLPPPRGDTDG